MCKMKMIQIEKNAGKYTGCIWEWWKPRVNEFPCHVMAIILDVLSQLSSCLAERVFFNAEIDKLST